MKKKERFLKKEFFWDVDFEKLDLWENRNYIIGRVLEWGDVDEVVALFKYYDKEVIIKACLFNTEISKRTISYLCSFFDVKPQDFRSWQRKQSTPRLSGFWNA